MTNKEQSESSTLTTTENEKDTAKKTSEKTKSPQEKAAMIKSEIKKAWNKLTDDDINLHESQPEAFFARVKEKHGTTREQAEARLQSIKNTCSHGCGSEKAA